MPPFAKLSLPSLSGAATRAADRLLGRAARTPAADQPCPECGGAADSLLGLNTYKRYWYLCPACGSAYSRDKERYALAGLDLEDLGRTPVTESTIYDYFTTPEHVACAIVEGRAFVEEVLKPHGIALAGQRVLDISGGNGHALDQLRAAGADVVLTEFNDRAVAYARETLGMDARRYDLNRDRLSQVAPGPFDLVLVRAAVMFALDLDAFLRELAAIVPVGGRVILDRCMRPTLGVLVRVQLDEFSYLILRQPEAIAARCERAGFELLSRQDDVDPTLYVYDHDLTPRWFALHYAFEISGAWALRNTRVFDFPARDRRMSRLILRRDRRMSRLILRRAR